MKSWKKLKEYALQSEYLTSDTTSFRVNGANIELDYSAQRINPQILDTLFELAHECNLTEKINELFSGKPVNTTENRPALHTALRAPLDEIIWVNTQNIIPEVAKARQTMHEISTKIRSGQWLGYSGKPITNVVNVGIGGSMLGSVFCIDALRDYVTDNLNFYFLSDIDPHAFMRITAKLNPETTLFIISSKSFTTPETLGHFQKALQWMNQKEHLDKHFIAITANVTQAKALGFEVILPIWDWVGGRYSFSSAINLITCIAIGSEQFHALLAGAHEMDVHFRAANFSNNLPVLLALIGIWNINFLNINNLLVLTYSQNLEYFVSYLQQLDMESNGKSTDKQGVRVDYETGPIIWGGLGNHAQHSYYQLLCQGTPRVAADMIQIEVYAENEINQMCIAHKEVLSKGSNKETKPHHYIPGKMPLNMLSLTDCSPKTIGALIALYEHKIFVQGVIWNINSFDQPGVESAKNLFRQYNWMS